MVFSKPTGYALRALAVLPVEGPYVRARDIAREVGVPAPYLAKILYTLATRGLIDSARGPGGGVRLARPARLITLGEVAEAFFEETPAEPCCLLGLDACGHRDNPCALRRAWNALQAEKAHALARVTIEDLQARNGTRIARPGSPARRRFGRILPVETVA
ncbi:Rrf2 family transcriptional regulator [Geothrix sp. 21YS21S-2]|uniref:RrF2 family transcriptional regulator n=1 Tax=Geothrix sp. 21YS21S-2 TaxID=3068893 RepID=UPI0027BA17E1|nr:Rrf2 family transcriptional regulator [Geothrix sp. 21YS21S-2]